jgi:hypothetical protein
MFVMHMPTSFKIGDTAACRINSKPAQLTWRDQHTLVIGDNNARRIVKTSVEYDMRVFFCDDGDGTRYSVEDIPGERFIISSTGEKLQ